MTRAIQIKFINLFLFISLSTANLSFAQSQCNGFIEKISPEINFFKKLKTLPAGIGKYNLANHQIIFLHQDFPSCVIRISPRAEIATISSSLNISGLYAYCDATNPCPDFLQTKEALIFDLSLLKPTLAKIGIADVDKSLRILNLTTLVHEGFHNFVQYNIHQPMFKPVLKNTPQYDDRNYVKNSCYNLDSITKSLINIELENLELALKFKHNFSQQKKYLAVFVKTRLQRWEYLNDQKCQELEEKLEYIEGLAEFSALWVMNQIYGSNSEHIYFAYENIILNTYQNHNLNLQMYYQLGALQILNLVNTKNQQFLFSKITHATQPGSAVFQLLRSSFGL